MPELPEVETIRRDLEERILNKKITSVEVFKKKIIKSAIKEFYEIVTNNAFTKIERRAKLLIFHFKKGGGERTARASLVKKYLLLHLKMTGQLIYKDEKSTIAGGHTFSKQDHIIPNKHTQVIFTFEDGSKLYFNDMRLFGFLKLVSEPEKAEQLKTYGLEPLTKDYTLDAFTKAVQRRQTTIKSVLLNQSIIAGIGNIYADEACYAAGIKPTTPANVLSVANLKKLYEACEAVLRLSIAKRGTSFNNFVDSEGKRGNFKPCLQVYGRGGEKCFRCATPIKKIRAAGRGTCYCPQCQK